MKKKIVIFASGSGSNAENIVKYFRQTQEAEVVAIFTNNAEAGVIKRAEKLNVPWVCFASKDFKNTEIVDQQLETLKPDLIVLAGFLLLFPARLLKIYPKRVLNIHPALLPAYGGKGMYGDHVHKAVLLNKESRHGVTVHEVNENYDEGAILAQESFEVQKGDSLDDILSKIHDIEFQLYPKVISKQLTKL